MLKTRENLYGMTKTEYLAELDKHISECYAMVDHFISVNNKEEIAAFRRYLQQAKVEKRRVLNT